MALILPRIYRHNLTHCYWVLFKKHYCTDKVINIEHDVIEEFTTQLLHKTNNRARFFKKIKQCVKLKIVDTNALRSQPVDVNNLNLDELDKLFINLNEENSIDDIEYLINKCKESRICPSTNTVLLLLQNFSYNGNVGVINEIATMVKYGNKNVYQAYSKFETYMAAALWVNGNVVQALKLFEDVYKNNPFLRRTIRLTIRYLLLDVTRSSEAVLVNIMKFIEHLYEDYQDIFLLVDLWQVCFLSEWHADQTVALDLLEKHEGLRNGINISYVVMILLKSHRIEAVYRLLEVLLKYDMKHEYTLVVAALFEYKLRMQDVQSATEIVHWAMDNEISLSSSSYERFIMLLLKKPYKPLKPSKESSQAPKLDFKF